MSSIKQLSFLLKPTQSKQQLTRMICTGDTLSWCAVVTWTAPWRRCLHRTCPRSSSFLCLFEVCGRHQVLWRHNEVLVPVSASSPSRRRCWPVWWLRHLVVTSFGGYVIWWLYEVWFKFNLYLNVWATLRFVNSLKYKCSKYPLLFIKYYCNPFFHKLLFWKFKT